MEKLSQSGAEMASHMRTSRAGLELIKQFEGYRPNDQELPDGRYIVGYGHVRGEKGEERLSKAEAEALLREHDLPRIEQLVQDSVLAPLNQNEFDALVSFAFNIGASAFVKSDVVAYLNSGNRLASATAMDVWRKARIGGRIQVVDALVRRRAAEKALFLTAPGHMPSAASVLYRPVADRPPALKAPVKPREIVVERSTPAEPISEPKQTAPEAAAESIRKQMQDILGTNGEKVSGPDAANDDRKEPVETDGASPEEIKAAISELAGHEEPSPGVQKSMWPPRQETSLAAREEAEEDLPPPPFLERVVTAPEPAAPAPKLVRDPEPQPPVTIIDDLEEVEIPPRAGMGGIGEGVRLQEPLVESNPDNKLLNAAPFGLLALIGAALAGYGFADFFGLVQSGETIESDIAVYLPPFLILLGALLLIVMGYYCLRTLFSKD
jgi:lysozyme